MTWFIYKQNIYIFTFQTRIAFILSATLYLSNIFHYCRPIHHHLRMHTRFRLNKKADRSRLTFPPTKLPFVLSNLSKIQQNVSNRFYRFLNPNLNSPWIFLFSRLSRFNESSVKTRGDPSDRLLVPPLVGHLRHLLPREARDVKRMRGGEKKKGRRESERVGATINLLRSRSDN